MFNLKPDLEKFGLRYWYLLFFKTDTFMSLMAGETRTPPPFLLLAFLFDSLWKQ